MFLDPDFDVNVLYPFVSAVMSDYSSAVFDAVYRQIPVVMYTPDLEQFKGGNIGLTFDVEANCASVITRTIPETIRMLEEISISTYFNKPGITEFYDRYLREFWNKTKATYDQIWNDIRKKANL